MNDGNDGGKGGTSLAGKEFVIVMVVFFSALSFTLGFFVGKKSVKQSGDQAPPAVQSVTQGAAAQSEPQEVRPAEPGNSRTATDVKDEHGEAEEKAASAILSVPRQLSSVEEKEKDTIAPTKNTEKTAAHNTGGDNAPSKGTVRVGSHHSAVMYSVQLGALKNAHEARHLKETFSRKGYKTFITITRLKKKEKVYKVKAGEFRDRKDAELLALKLKKNEGLHAFVTLKNE
jgi:cell division septation protein DedD